MWEEDGFNRKDDDDGDKGNGIPQILLVREEGSYFGVIIIIVNNSEVFQSPERIWTRAQFREAAAEILAIFSSLSALAIAMHVVLLSEKLQEESPTFPEDDHELNTNPHACAQWVELEGDDHEVVTIDVTDLPTEDLP